MLRCQRVVAEEAVTQPDVGVCHPTAGVIRDLAGQ